MKGEIRQIGLVSKDISKELENFKKLFGLPEINIMETEITKNRYKEQIEPIKIRFAFTMIDKMQFEFIQPIKGETIYDSFLEKTDGGIHHLGLYVEDFEGAIKEMEVNKLTEIFNGIIAGIRFAYFDTTETLGYILELIEVKSKRTGK